MIRLPAMSTGVEVIGSHGGLIDLGPLPGTEKDALAAVGIVEDPGTSFYEQPELMVCEILLVNAGSETVIGQLVLCDPAADQPGGGVYELQQSLGTSKQAVVNKYYGDVWPGQERWIWDANVNLWGLDEFYVRNDPFASVLMSLSGNCHVDFQQQLFDTQSSTEFEPNGAPRYRVFTDDPLVPVGCMVLVQQGDQLEQQWYGRKTHLYQGLIAPSAEGEWRFERRTGASNTGYGKVFVPLELQLGPSTVSCS